MVVVAAVRGVACLPQHGRDRAGAVERAVDDGALPGRERVGHPGFHGVQPGGGGRRRRSGVVEARAGVRLTGRPRGARTRPGAAGVRPVAKVTSRQSFWQRAVLDRDEAGTKAMASNATASSRSGWSCRPARWRRPTDAGFRVRPTCLSHRPRIERGAFRCAAAEARSGGRVGVLPRGRSGAGLGGGWRSSSTRRPQTVRGHCVSATVTTARAGTAALALELHARATALEFLHHDAPLDTAVTVAEQPGNGSQSPRPWPRPPVPSGPARATATEVRPPTVWRWASPTPPCMGAGGHELQPHADAPTGGASAVASALCPLT